MPETYELTYFNDTYGTLLLNGYDATADLTIHLLGYTNFSNIPMHVITTRGPLQDGDTQIDYRLDPRIVTISCVVKNESVNPIYNRMQIIEKLHNIFIPYEPIQWIRVTSYVTTPVTERFLNCTLIGFDILEDTSNFHVKFTITLRAANPLWYADGTDVISASYTTAQFNSNNTVNMVGSYYSYPYDLRVYGPIVNPKIQVNNSDGITYFQFTQTMVAGDQLIIDLSYGVKSAKLNGTSILNKLTAASNFAQWRFKPGTNLLRFEGTGIVSPQTTANFQTRPQYLGV